MKICSNCRIELDEHMNYCPVCGEPSEEPGMGDTHSIKITKKYPKKARLTGFQKLTPPQKRKLVWEVSGIVFLSAICVTFIIDFVSNKTITWSIFPIVISALVFVNITIISFLLRRVVLTMILVWGFTSFVLVFLDGVNGNLNWSFELGIPLLTVSYILGIALVVLIKKMKNKGLNIVAFGLIAAGLLCLGTEAVISRFGRQRLELDWSIIVMASVLPIAIILLILHQRLKNHTDLKRFFHI